MPTASIDLKQALDLARTGDVWLFRGYSVADRAIRVATNSPVNHVGMSVVIDDLPPLMWHAELGRSLPDLWSGSRHRGVQLHDLRDSVTVWATRYGQRAWLRQLEPAVTPEMEDAIRRQTHDTKLETAYCAEVLAITYQAMGLLPGKHDPSWFDAGRFWSGDNL